MTTPLQQLVERMKPLQVMLAQNTYIKDTTRRLKRMIDDANAPKIVLLMGKEGVGKTTLINSLLGQELLSTSDEQPTMVHTFIRYSEESYVRAYFLDGMVATFDISKVELLTTAMTESAQIIRGHIDFVEVAVPHPLLKTVTLVDSMALQVTESRSAYLSELLIERADEVMWVIHHGFPATEGELVLLERLQQKGRDIHLVVNGIDTNIDEVEAFVQQEQSRYGQSIASVTAVSARLALAAAKEKDEALLQQSRVADLHDVLQQLTGQMETKTKNIVSRFVSWLEMCRIEFEQIPFKEPYASALQTVVTLNGDEGFEFTRQERDAEILSAYEQEYAQVCDVFKSVETLYQLLQKLTQHLYLRTEKVEQFEDVALRYQLAVREYRKMHMEYAQSYGLLDQQYRKAYGKGIERGELAEIVSNSPLQRAKQALDERQQKLVQQFEMIKQYEKLMLEQLYSTQNQLNDLAERRLRVVLQQVTELNVQRKREVIHMQSYVKKLSEFACLEEAQAFVREAIVPYLQSGALPLSEEELAKALDDIDKLCSVEIQQNIEFNVSEEASSHVIEHDFDTKYALIQLWLTEADVVSDIPECPQPLMLK